MLMTGSLLFVAEPVVGAAALPAVAVGLLLPLMWAAERVLPFREAWNSDHDDTRADVGVGVLQLGATLLVTRGGSVLAATLAAPMAPGEPLQAAAPFVAVVVLALVGMDLAAYGAHRALHRWAGLWRFHALHHSAPRLYVINAARLHPVDAAVVAAASVVVLPIVGERAFAWATALTAAHLLMQHANLDVDNRWLGRILALAPFHRWHHHPAPGRSAVNYGHVFSFFDDVFGTAQRTTAPFEAEPGVGEEGYPSRLWAQLRWSGARRSPSPRSPR